MSCGNCQFFVSEGDGTAGYCRRFPASVRRRADYWCGEYKRRVVQKGGAGGKAVDK